MLPSSEQVDKLDIDHHYALVLDELKDLFRSHLTRYPPRRLRAADPWIRFVPDLALHLAYTDLGRRRMRDRGKYPYDV